jgi:HD-GYP domain-containing protein (c-di-GMP phosphodiesterase class II)
MQKRTVVGGVAVAAGLAALAVSALPFSRALPTLVDDDQFPGFALAAMAFIGCVFLLAVKSVEVNDRLYMSSSIMAILAGAFVLSTWPIAGMGLEYAPFWVTLLAAAAAINPGDLRQRKVFNPAFNFGQLALSGLGAGVTLWVLIGAESRLLAAAYPQAGIGLVQEGGPLPFSLWTPVLVAVAALVAAAVFISVNILSVWWGARIIYGRRRQPWVGLPRLLASQGSMSVAGALLGLVLVASESRASLIPVVLLLFVNAHTVFSSHAQLRASHEATIDGFIKILEARDLYTRGHTERVAEFARLIGEELKLRPDAHERLRYAALIHDVGKLAVPTAIMRKQGRLTDDEYRTLRRATHQVDDMLSEVGFLVPMVVIASGVHPRLAEEDFGQRRHTHARYPTVEQSALAVADAFDAMTSTRAYRMAMSQETALATMTDSDDPLFRPEVVAALRAALERAGLRYGPPHLAEPARSGRPGG